MLINQNILHIGYAVDDIEKAAAYWASVMGAGPFFVAQDIRFEMVESGGEPCAFHHSTAFGQCGPFQIELQQIHPSTSQSLKDRLIPGRRPVINHIAYMSADPEAKNQTLKDEGHEMFLHAKLGEIEVWFHDARSAIGHAIEIHRKSEAALHMNQKVREAALGWDGMDLIRSFQ
jgi:hypothetical protein